MTPADRFWDLVDASGDCWLWTAGRNGKGYGITYVDGRRQKVAHRWAYEHLVGPVPPGLQLDHLCRVKACVNPDHLEPVTSRTNTLRGVSGPARNARLVKCIRGHPFTPENTKIKVGGKRRCRECSHLDERRYRQKKRAML